MLVFVGQKCEVLRRQIGHQNDRALGKTEISILTPVLVRQIRGVVGRQIGRQIERALGKTEI